MQQTTLDNEHLIRQSELVPSEILITPVTIVGAGAIGSFTALTLAKMGFSDITVFDFDTVDIVNMSSQFYRFSDIGKPKVKALYDLIKDFTGVEIKTKEEYLEGRFDGVVVSAVDSMRVRDLIWTNHKLKSFGTKFVIDPRMGAETAALYVTRPLVMEEVERYEATLHNDDNAVQERCTAKVTMYTALMLSGLVAKVIRDVLSFPDYKWQYQWSLKADDLMSWENRPKLTMDEFALRPRHNQTEISATPRHLQNPDENILDYTEDQRRLRSQRRLDFISAGDSIWQLPNEMNAQELRDYTRMTEVPRNVYQAIEHYLRGTNFPLIDNGRPVPIRTPGRFLPPEWAEGGGTNEPAIISSEPFDPTPVENHVTDSLIYGTNSTANWTILAGNSRVVFPPGITAATSTAFFDEAVEEETLEDPNTVEEPFF